MVGGQPLKAANMIRPTQEKFCPPQKQHRHMGVCRSNGSLFHKKSLNMGPIFYKNIPKHGSIFHL